MKQFLFLILGVFILTCSCKKNSCSNSVKAEFHDATGIGGCGIVIKLTNEKFIEPRNLDDFNIEPQPGEKVWVTYHLAQSGGTVCMIGDVVIIDCITKR